MPPSRPRAPLARPVLSAAGIAIALATAAAAAPLAHVALTKAAPRLQRTDASAAPPVPTPMKRIWEGADVDGDGRADFANPTGLDPRGHDAYGDGGFGARRDGGARRHEGVDFRARAGQAVDAPMSGYVTRIGYAYEGDANLTFVEITNPALRYAVRVFYVKPDVAVGQAVAVGQPIGAAHTLQKKYPGGMTDHVHLEIIDRRGDRIDAREMLTAAYVPDDRAVGD